MRDMVRRFLLVLAFAFLLTAYAHAAPVEIFNDRIDVDGGNVTELDWLNPGGGAANIGADLDMRGNALLTYFSSRCSEGEAIEDIADDGTITCTDIAGSVADVYVNESGDTMSGDLDMSGNVVREIGANLTNFTSHGELDMADIIDMNSNRIKGLTDPSSSQDAMTKSFADSEYLTRSGDSMSGDLDMVGNVIKNVDALGNGTTRTIELTGTGNVIIPNGNLDVSGNNINNFFGAACSDGQAVEDIGDDGTLNCVSITGAAADTYVNESGDTMSGDLNMSGNALWRVGAGQTNITSSGDIEVGGIVDLNSNRIKSLQDPSSSQDAMTKSFADSTYLNRDGSDSMTGTLDMNSNDIVNVNELGINTGSPLSRSRLDVQGNASVSGKMMVAESQTSNEVNGTLYLGRSGGSYESIRFDNTRGTDGKFVFSKPQRVPEGSPPITFFDPAAPGDVSRQFTFEYNASTKKFGFGNIVTLNFSQKLADGGQNPRFKINGSMEVDGDIDTTGKFIGETDSIGWDNLTAYPPGCDSGNAIRVLGDTVTCASISGETHELYINESGDTMHGDLDMEMNQITRIGSGRSNFTSTGRLDMGDIIHMNTNRVRGVQDPTSSQDAVTLTYADSTYLNTDSPDTMTADLDMDGNNLLNVDAIGNGTVRTIEMDTTGNVFIPNGNLKVGGGTIEAPIHVQDDGDFPGNSIGSTALFLEPDSDGADISLSLNTTRGQHRVWNLRAGSGGSPTEGFRIYDATADSDRFTIDSSGNVNIPNGNLDVTGGRIEVEDTTGYAFRYSGWGTNDEYRWVPSGSDSFSAEAQLRWYNSTTGTQTNVIEATTGGNVKIPNGDLDMNSNRIKGLQDPSSSQDAMTKSFADSTYLNRDGTDTMTGDLDMNNNNIVNARDIEAVQDHITAAKNNNDRFGYFEVHNTSDGDGVRGFYLGWGDASNRNVDFQLDYANELDFGGGTFDMQGNNIKNPGSITSFFGSSCPSGQAVQDVADGGGFTCTSLSGETHDLYVNESGDTMSGILNMGSNRITNVADPSSSQDAATFNWVDSNFLYRDGSESMTGDLDMSGNNLLNVDALGNGTVRTIEMTTGGNVNIPNGDLNIADGQDIRVISPSRNLLRRQSGVIEVGDGNDPMDLEGSTVDIPNGNLRLQNNSIESIGGGGSGYVGIGTGNNADPGLTIHDTGDSKKAHLQLAGGGAVVFRDDTGNNVLRLMNDGTQEVDIQNGVLDMNSNRVVSVADPTSSQDAMTKSFADSTYLNRDGTDSMTGNLDMSNNNVLNVEALMADGSTTNLDLVDGGNVNIPNGNLTVGDGGHTQHLIRIRDDSSFGSKIGYSPNLGDNGGTLVQSGDGKDVALAVDNGTFESGTNALIAYHTANIEIPNGNLNMGSNQIKSVADPTSSQDAVTESYATTTYLNRDGTDSMTGNLDMNNNNVQNANMVIMNDIGQSEGLSFSNGRDFSVSTSTQGGEDAFQWRTDSTYPIEIETHDSGGTDTDRFQVTTGVNTADVDILNSNLDLNGNSITNFFGTGCSSGEAVQDVADGGGFTCTSLSGQTHDLYVNESGDTMSGILNMGSNRITSVADPSSSQDAMTKGFADSTYLNRDGTDTMAGDLDMNDNDIVNVNEMLTDSLNVTNASSGTQIAHFDDSGITFQQPLSLETSGGFSTSGGITLTDSTSNTIESQSTFYLSTSSGSPTDIVLQPTGVVGMQSNVDMASNNITNLNYINSGGTTVNVGGALNMEGNVDMNGNNVQNPGSITSYFASACPSGQAIQDVSDSGGFTCVDVGAGGTTEDVYVNESGDTMSGVLNMGSNQIASVADPTSSQDAMTLNYANNNYLNRDGTDSMTGNLDMNNNNVVNINSLLFNDNQGDGSRWNVHEGGGNGALEFVNNSNSVDLFHMELSGKFEVLSGDVDIPNGNLDVNSPSNTGGALDVGGAVNIDNGIDTVQHVQGPNGADLAFSTGGASDDFELRDDGNTVLIRGKNGGNVEIPNGDLKVGNDLWLRSSNDRLTDVEGIEGDENGGAIDFTQNAESLIKTETSNWTIRDSGDSLDIARFKQNTQNVEIPNGYLDMGSNDIRSVADPDASQDAVTKSYADSTYLNRDGTDTMTGDLDMNNNDIVNVERLMADGTTTNLDLVDGGQVNIPNGNLDIKGNQIRGIDELYSNYDISSHINFDSSGNIRLKTSDSSGTSTIGLTLYNTSQNVEIPNGKLDVDAGDTTYGSNSAPTLELGVDGSQAGTIKFYGGTAGDTALIQQTSNNLHLDAGGTGGDIYLNHYQGDDTFIRDGSGNNVAVFRNGGNVEVPNGPLDMTGGTGDVQLNQVTLQSNGVLHSQRSDDNLYLDAGTGGGTILLRDGGNNDIIRAKDNNNVEIPNGNLNLNDNLIEDFRLDADAGAMDGVPFDIDGSAVEMRYHDNSGQFRFVPYNTSSNTWFWSDRLHYDVSNRRWMIRTNLNMDSNRVRSVQDPTSSQDAVTLSYANNNYLNSDSTDTMNGDLDMNGNNILNVDALGNGTTRTIEMTTGGDVNMPNGDLVVGGDPGGSQAMRIDGDLHVGNTTHGGSISIQTVHDGTLSDHHIHLQSVDDASVAENIALFHANQNDPPANTLSNSEMRIRHSGEIFAPRMIFDKSATSTGATPHIRGSGSDLVMAVGGNVQIPSGNLGVGVSSPGEEIEVEGTNANILLDTTSSTDYTNVQFIGGAGQEWHAGMGSQNVGNADLQGNFYIHSSDDGAQGLRIMNGTLNVEIPNGNLDIGSPTNTGATLDVGGELNVEGGVSAMHAQGSTEPGVRLENTQNSTWDIFSGGGGGQTYWNDLVFYRRSGTTGNVVVEHGNLEITNGNLDMTSQQIRNAGLSRFTGLGVADSFTKVQNNVNGYSAYIQQNLTVDGDIIGGGGDVAESIKTEESGDSPDSGDVVTLSGNMSVSKTTEKYDTSVAGVVSTDPAMVMAQERGGVPVAMTGTVPVKVTGTNGEIAPGDSLTTSQFAGRAMKCRERERCEGAIIGKAMEPASTNTTVNMLVSLG